MKEKKEQHTISRRDFLRGMAAGAVGVAATSVLGTTALAEESAGENAVQPSAGVPGYEVYNTDLLIIGAGFGAMSAAFEAIAKGQSVVMIDKGPFRHGGNAGYNWDVIATWVPDESYYSSESYLTKMVNQELFYKAEQSEPNPNTGLTVINRGECLPKRNEDGSLNLYLDMPMAMKIWNVYRSRLIGQIMQDAGLNVIPTLQWAEVETLNFCFDGIEQGGVVAVSTVGVMKNLESQDTWRAGMDTAMEKIRPECVLCYGSRINYDFRDVKVKYVEARKFV